jgi:hypothetical protein
MERFFNNAGPTVAEDHYCLDPLTRLALDTLMGLFRQRRYFILHAPRQTGKTTSLLALMKHLNQQGEYTALYANVEIAQSARENVDAGILAILQTIALQARYVLNDTWLEENFRRVFDNSNGHSALQTLLSEWCERLNKPLVLMLDEIDALVGDTLISVLRQLRGGYPARPERFPSSVILCGVRDVQDYRIHSSAEKAIITGGSAFNVKAKSLRLGDFSQSECMELLQQHTDETGQVFTPEARELLWDFSRGQPWLLNALAYNATFEIKACRDRSVPIEAPVVWEARERMVQERVTHLDQLVDKLKEERVRSVMIPLLEGGELPEEIPTDDLHYVHDLGLIRLRPQVEIANPIYREVIPRELTFTTQVTIAHPSAWYLTPEGLIDMPKLLSAFQQFYREHSEAWFEGFAYREAGPQLLLQAFLQRIVNGGGRIEREYGLGRKRTDLMVLWPGLGGNPFDPHGKQRIVLEVKRIRARDGAEAVRREGLHQTAAYMDTCNATEGHLLLVDQRPDRSWDERVYQENAEYEGHSITVWGL